MCLSTGSPADSIARTARCETLRWPSGPHCPRCRSSRVSRRADTARPFACAACRHRFSLTTGTVLHASHISLDTWLTAFELFFASPKALTGTQLQRQLGDANSPTVSLNTTRRMAKILRSLAPYSGGDADQALRLALSIHPSRRPTAMSTPSPLIPTNPPRTAGDSFVAKAVNLLDSALDGLNPAAQDWNDRTVYLNRLSRSLRDVGHFVQSMTTQRQPATPATTDPLPTPAYWPTETVEEWNARQAREAAEQGSADPTKEAAA